MKTIIVSSKVLANACKELNKIKNNVHIPSLDYYLVESKNKEVWISRTDLHDEVKIGLGAETNFEGSFLMSKEMGDLANKIEEQPICIHPLDNDKVMLTGADNLKTTILAKPVRDYPNMTTTINTDDMRSVGSMDYNEFREIFEIMNKFVSGDELRPAMTGVCFNSNHFVETNGHFLKMIDNKAFDITKEIVIRNVFKYIPRLRYNMSSCHTIELLLNETTAQIKSDGYVINTRLIDEKFPDYLSVLPQKFNTTIKVKTSELVQAATEALIFANKTTSQLRFKTSKHLEVHAEDTDFQNEYEKTVPFESFEGLGMEFGFNGKFLLEVLKHLGDTTTIQLEAPNKGAMFNGDTLLMPVMLNNNLD